MSKTHKIVGTGVGDLIEWRGEGTAAEHLAPAWVQETARLATMVRDRVFWFRVRKWTILCLSGNFRPLRGPYLVFFLF